MIPERILVTENYRPTTLAKDLTARPLPLSRISAASQRGGPIPSDSFAAGISLVPVVVRPPISRRHLPRMLHRVCDRPEMSGAALRCNSRSSG